MFYHYYMGRGQGTSTASKSFTIKRNQNNDDSVIGNVAYDLEQYRNDLKSKKQRHSR